MKYISLINEEIVKNNLIDLKNIVFEVTEKCNLRCKYCGLSERLYERHDLRESRDLSFNKARIIIDYLLDIWKNNYKADTTIPFIVGFYGGEPLLNMSIIKKIVDYFESSNTSGRMIHYAMTTNAILLDKHMDYLAEKDFYLTISLDGDENAQSYRVDHRNKNSFNTVFKNIKLLQQNYPEYFNKEYVNFMSVLHNRNDVEPIIDFFKLNFNKVPQIAPLNDNDISNDKKDEFWEMYQNKSQSLLKSSNCEALEDMYFLEMPSGFILSQFLYHTSGNIYYNYNHLLMDRLGENLIPTGTCTPFAKKMFLTVDGKILPCERISHDFELGYVNDSYVELDYDFVVNKHNSYLLKNANKCMSCATNIFCPQCVYHIDDIRSKSPHCWNFCTKQKFEDEKLKNFAYLRAHPHYYQRILNDISFTL